MQTSISFTAPDWAFVSTDDQAMIDVLRDMAERRPDECVIVEDPADSGGVMRAKCPPRWVRIKPPAYGRALEEAQAYREAQAFLVQLRHSRLTGQQKNTLRGQALGGDLEGAWRGFERLTRGGA